MDLVPRDCCQTERVDLETKLQRLEQSLNGWLLEKLAAIESERLAPSVDGTSAYLLGQHSESTVARIEGHVSGQEEVIVMSTDERDTAPGLRIFLPFQNDPRTPATPATAT